MRHRNKSGQFVSNEQVKKFAAKHYDALNATPLPVHLLGLRYWPRLGKGLLLEDRVASTYKQGMAMANEIASMRAWDFFWQFGLVVAGLYVAWQHDLRLTKVIKAIPSDWGEVITGAVFLVGLWVKCFLRGRQLDKHYDDFAAALGLPPRGELIQD